MVRIKNAFINHLLILDNIKVACMFRDDGDSIKVSLRSNGSWDVGLLARKFGGGGHSHSAATVLVRTENENVVLLIRQMVEKMTEYLSEIKC
jgi:phosphoesterase RecJ-like protein